MDSERPDSNRRVPVPKTDTLTTMLRSELIKLLIHKEKYEIRTHDRVNDVRLASACFKPLSQLFLI